MLSIQTICFLMQRYVHIALLVLIFFSPACLLATPSLSFESKIISDLRNSNDELGWSVDIDGTTAIVSAPLESCLTGTNCGAAYIYTLVNDEWILQSKLTALDAHRGDSFGYRVSIDNDTAVIGAPNDNCIDGLENPNIFFSGCGAAYVFTRSGNVWTQQAKLVASDIADDDLFGIYVDIDADTIIVGSIWDDDKGFNSGSAYIFTRSGTTWSEQAKLIANDGASLDSFGKSVSISGDTVIIGSPLNDIRGTAYVFTRAGTSWTQQTKLVTSNAGQFTNDEFGTRVSIDTDTAIVSAWRESCSSVLPQECGAVYVFNRAGNNWSQQAKLVASDRGNILANFGTSLDILGDTVAVSAPSRQCYQGENCGVTYIYKHNGNDWYEHTKVSPSDQNAYDKFGNSVRLNGDNIIIGSPRDACNDNQNDLIFLQTSSCGASYVYNDVSTLTYNTTASLPSGRSVQVGAPASFFASMINIGSNNATGCVLSPNTSIAADFSYQRTNPLDNSLVGNANTPFNINAGEIQTLYFSFTPNLPINTVETALDYYCENSVAAEITAGINTLGLTADNNPVPDVIGLTTVVDLQANIGATSLFAVGSANIGATANITVSLDDGGKNLPLDLKICQTDSSGACNSAIASSFTFDYLNNTAASFAIFAQPIGLIANDPASNRIFIRFTDSNGVLRGGTSTAVSAN